MKTRVILGCLALIALLVPVGQAAAHPGPGGQPPHLHTACTNHASSCDRWIRVNGVIVQGPHANRLAEEAGGFVLVTCSISTWHATSGSGDLYGPGPHWHWLSTSTHTYCHNPRYTSGKFILLPWSLGPT